MRGISVRTALAAAIVSSAFVLPTAASAATTVSFTGNVIAIQGDSDDNVIYETSFDDATPWFTTPSPATLTAGAGCTQLSPQNVECAGANANTTARINLGDGDDLFLWSPTNVPMTISGGDGDDELSGGQGNDTIDGGNGDDVIVGYGGDDRLDGGAGIDVIDGSSGNDRIDGGPGVDKLNGDGEGDVDFIANPFGNDTIISRDNVRDEVECEGGTDTVIADVLDQVAKSCESIDYPKSDSPLGSGSGGGSGPVTVTEANTTLTLKLTRRKLPKLGKFAAGSKVGVTIRSTAACRATSKLTVSAAQAKSLRYKSKRTLGTASKQLSANKSLTVNLGGTKAFRRALKGKKSTSLTFTVTCKPKTGKSVTAKLTMKLKR